MMDLTTAIRIAVERTGHTRFLALLDPDSPAYDPRYERVVRAIAEGKPLAPSLLQRAANLAGAVVEHVAAGLPQATPEVAAARLALCQACPQFRAGSCALCGCKMAVKVTWAEQKCPEGKW